ncbi:MAG: phosphate-starvation-inducible protein PsiE [Gammaproteobacteria bacterium]|nr:phosphate-starvation-inducible protein PsiE [Gammaproteobacteria bacterium]
MQPQWPERLRDYFQQQADTFGNLLVDSFHFLALFVIGAITAWAAVITVGGLLTGDSISIDDILLLFIYLELGSMVGIYFKTRQMPVRFLIYVAMTALTRLMISDISHHNEPGISMLYVSGAILLLALSILVIGYYNARFPARDEGEAQDAVTACAKAPAQENS